MIKNLIQRLRNLDSVRKRYLGFTMGILITFFLVLTLVYIVQIGIYERKHAENSRNQLIEIKREVLNDTVSNMINNIDIIKNNLEETYKSRLTRYTYNLGLEVNLNSMIDFLSNQELNSDILAIIKTSQGEIVFQTDKSQGYE